ncbi:MAG: glycogen debranching enzyme GlgX, partial [Actinomycetota bacterium]
LTPDGDEMTDEEWASSFARSLGVQMSGILEGEVDAQGRPEEDDDFLLLLNAHHEGISFTIPQNPDDARWELVMDTSYAAGLKGGAVYKPGDEYPLKPRSMAVLTNVRPREFVDEEAE